MSSRSGSKEERLALRKQLCDNDAWLRSIFTDLPQDPDSWLQISEPERLKRIILAEEQSARQKGRSVGRYSLSYHKRFKRIYEDHQKTSLEQTDKSGLQIEHDVRSQFNTARSLVSLRLYIQNGNQLEPDPSQEVIEVINRAFARRQSEPGPSIEAIMPGEEELRVISDDELWAYFNSTESDMTLPENNSSIQTQHRELLRAIQQDIIIEADRDSAGA